MEIKKMKIDFGKNQKLVDKIIKKRKITAKRYLKTVLKDDETEIGGISFSGETLKDFLDEIFTPYNVPMNIVNDMLKNCGIKEIKI